MRIVAGAQRPIKQVGDDAHVVAVLRQHVDVGRLGTNLVLRIMQVNLLSTLIEELEGTEANVVIVAPR